MFQEKNDFLGVIFRNIKINDLAYSELISVASFMMIYLRTLTTIFQASE